MRASWKIVLGLLTLAALAFFGWMQVGKDVPPDAPQSGEGPSGEDERPKVDDLEPSTARWDQARELAEDLARPRDASDGKGSARIVTENGERASVQVGALTRWTLVYTAGLEGIAVGGEVHFMPEPFWGWSVPQTISETRAGFTTVSTDAEGVELESRTIGNAQTGYLSVRIGGRALEEGEEIQLVYGAGEVGARADRHAERDAHLWFYVDGNGDGIRGLVEDSPSLDVTPGPPNKISLIGPTVARPGDTVRFTVAVLDQLANTGLDVKGDVRLLQRPPSWDVPETVALGPGGRATIEVVAASTGVVRLRAAFDVDGGTLETDSNPLWVSESSPRVYWGDLHGHSNYSDGTGLPEDFYAYARDVSALDVAVLTDHDHFGVRFLDQHPDLWADIVKQTTDFHEPGRFVTVLGYEWTSWIHGHRHVLYFRGEGEILSSLDPAYKTPRQLWDALRGQDALTFAHHSAGDPVPTNWTFAPDPEVEPVTEVMSVHGSSEAYDSPRLLRRPLRGNFVRDVLDRGVRFGFIGSGDSHDGHPGLAHLSPVYGWLPARGGSEERVGTGGLAGILATELTRDGVLEALRARRVYATSGPRILLDVQLDGHPLGSTIARTELGEEPTLRVVVLGTAGLARIDVVRSSGVRSLELTGERRFVGELPLETLEAGEYVYLRVVQTDEALAWSSPFFVE